MSEPYIDTMSAPALSLSLGVVGPPARAISVHTRHQSTRELPAVVSSYRVDLGLVRVLFGTVFLDCHGTHIFWTKLD